MVDRYHLPERNVISTTQQQRVSDQPMYGVAHSAVKNSDAGTRSTFTAATYYMDEARNRRDELLAKYRNEESS
jgi:hypothetical protein